MKILTLSSLLNQTPPRGYGGTERFVHILGNNLVEQGHDVTTVSLEGSEGGKYNIVHTKSADVLDVFTHTFKKTRPDIVHINTKNLEILNFLKKVSIPVVITLYNNFRKSSSWVDVMKTAPANFHFTVISENLKERVYEALEHHKINSTRVRIRITGYGMDVDAYQQKYINKPRNKYIYLGVIAPYKGVLDIVKAFSNLDKYLLIVGHCNNPAEKNYFNEVLVHTSKNNISYHGETNTEEEKVDLLLSAKALVIATGYDPKEADCHEAFGLVMLEANSLGTPVIGFAKGNIKDYVVDSENGYKFTAIEELPELIKKIETTDLSEKCIKYSKQFDIRLVAKKYNSLFESLILGSKS